jgi:hypothetical protein
MITEETAGLRESTRWWGRLAVGLALSLISIVLLIRNVQWADVWTSLTAIHPFLLLVALAALTFNYLLIALRWRLLFSPQERLPSVHSLFACLMIAQLANVVLPLRISPLLRAYLAGQEAEGGVSFALSTIAIEKVLDGLVFSLFVLALLPLVVLPDWLRASGWSVGLIFGALFVAMLILTWQKGRLVGWSERLVIRFSLPAGQRIVRLVNNMMQVLDVWRERRLALALGGLSLIVWLSTALLYAVTLQALNIHTSPLVPFILVVVLQAGIRLPSLPANIGVFHYLSALVLTMYLVPPGDAVSYGLVLHAISFVFPALLGVVYLWRRSVPLSQLTRMGSRG